MPTARYAGRMVQVNDQGYMTDPSQWDRDIAVAIAEANGMASLTDRHWTVIEFCRSYHEETGEPPGVRVISTRTGFPTRDLYLLFPKGPGKLAARIAGLTKPQSCV